MLNAGGQADFSVVKRLFMGVGQGFSLFVRKLGIKLIANQGPVSMQAQNGTLELLARHGLSITSTEDEIHLTAKKKISLNGGGSYLSLDAGYRLVMANSVVYQIPTPTDYRNPEQAHLANAGFHNHPSKNHSEVSQPTSHTEYRTLYSTVMDDLSPKEEDSQ
ncbi:hypothetical protein D3C75_965200 [compost metagenome]